MRASRFAYSRPLQVRNGDRHPVPRAAVGTHVWHAADVSLSLEHAAVPASLDVEHCPYAQAKSAWYEAWAFAEPFAAHALWQADTPAQPRAQVMTWSQLSPLSAVLSTGAFEDTSVEPDVLTLVCSRQPVSACARQQRNIAACVRRM